MCEKFTSTPYLLLYATELADQYKKDHKFFYRARAPVLYHYHQL